MRQAGDNDCEERAEVAREAAGRLDDEHAVGGETEEGGQGEDTMIQREVPQESEARVPPAQSEHLPAEGPGSREQANKWVVLLLAATGAFMTTLDSSIVNISLPAIAHSFGVPLSGTIEWIIIGYLVVIAAAFLTFRRLAHVMGRRPACLGDLSIFL